MLIHTDNHKKICQLYFQLDFSHNYVLVVFSSGYGVPFSHLFTALEISPIELKISPIELEISTIDLQISTIHLEISPNMLNCRYLQLN